MADALQSQQAMSLSLGFQILGLALVAIIAIHHRWLAVRIHVRSRPEPLRWPRLAVLRPIRGLDPGAAQNLDALLDSDYPGSIEFLFLLDDADDASFPLVEAAIARHSQLRARIVLTGTPPPHRTGKIHKMIHGADLVDADVLAFSDSDTRPQPGMLRELVSLLESDPRNGIAFAPTVAVAEDVHTGDVGYELLVNAWYGAAVDRVAGERGEVPFAMGQLMLIRTTALAAIGTMRAAEGELVDDMFLGRKMIEHGYANVTCSTRVPVVIGGMALVEFLRVFRKWIFFSQSGLPTAFKTAGWMRALPGFGAWATTIAGMAIGSAWVIAVGLLALAAFVASQVRLSSTLGGSPIAPRFYWLAAMMPFFASGVALSTKLNHEVGWRGRRYRLDHAGRLRAV
ncbi:MAG TPA: glycosyltransferase [Kofleriaceae bacterium]|nr:glycosyltransferase [Kofleriaceae bacterium]